MDQPTPRNDDIFLMRENGATYAEIADKHGISVTRCQQIYKKEHRMNIPVISSREWNEAYKIGFDDGVQSMRAKLLDNGHHEPQHNAIEQGES